VDDAADKRQQVWSRVEWMSVMARGVCLVALGCECHCVFGGRYQTEEGCPDCPPGLWRCLLDAGGCCGCVARVKCWSFDREVEVQGRRRCTDAARKVQPKSLKQRKLQSNNLFAPPTSSSLVRSAQHAYVCRSPTLGGKLTDQTYSIPKSSYYDAHYRQSASLLRARQPYLVKNIFTGLGIFAFTVGVCT
jgi:hypothetical protein